MVIAIKVVGAPRNNFDLDSVIESIKEIKKELSAPEVVKDFEIHKVKGGREITQDAEEIEVICCARIKISSNGLLEKLHPGVIGEYTKIEDVSKRQLYKKADSSNLYIYKPPSMKRVGMFPENLS